MKGEKMYREEDDVVICKTCGIITAVGFNILQENEFEAFKSECIENCLCPQCLKKSRINAVINNDSVLIDTAKNMIAVGVI